MSETKDIWCPLCEGVRDYQDSMENEMSNNSNTIQVTEEEIQEWDRKTKDTINPDHYKVGGIETIDYMKAKASAEEFKGHLRLTAIKYLSRGPYKADALEDYKKAQWYLSRLIAEMEGK